MRHRNRFAWMLLLAAVLLGMGHGSAPVMAADGRIPIYQLPLTITSPGSYYLTQDLDHSSAGQSITIQSSDVTIDFNGHKIYKDNDGNYTIGLNGDYTNIRIHNGSIEKGNIGIRLKNATGSDFNVRIEDMEIRNTLNEGIYVEGQALIGSSQALIERNMIHDTGNDGIHARFMWGGRIADNLIQGPGDHGIYGHSLRGVTIRGNTISHGVDDGIRLAWSWYCTVDWNHMTYNSAFGFRITDGDSHVFSNNRALGNSSAFSIPGAEGHVNAGGNYPPP